MVECHKIYKSSVITQRWNLFDSIGQRSNVVFHVALCLVGSQNRDALQDRFLFKASSKGVWHLIHGLLHDAVVKVRKMHKSINE